MADYDNIKECFDELTAAVLGGLRGFYDRVLLEEAKRLVCNEHFVPSPGLMRFLDAMPVEVDRMRKEDPVVNAYFQLEEKFRQIQLDRKVSQHKRQKTELPKTKRDELKVAKDKAVEGAWNLLLDRGIQNPIVVDAMALHSEGYEVNIKRCLQLHIFAYDLHASLKLVQADSKQSVSKKSFKDTLRHCITCLSQPYFCIIPVSFRPLIATSVELEVRKSHDAPETSDDEEVMPDEAIQKDAVVPDGAKEPDEAVQGDEEVPANPAVGGPKSFVAAWKSFQKRVSAEEVIEEGIGEVDEDVELFLCRIKSARKKFPERVRKAAGDMPEMGAIDKELILKCITVAPTTKEELEEHQSCAAFLDHFFELPMWQRKPSKLDVLTFEVRKDAFLEQVACVHSKTSGALREEMKEKLKEMHADRPGGRVLQWSPLAEIAVDVMLEVLDGEWRRARHHAELKESLEEKGCLVFVMRHGTYTVPRFRRAVRACELRLCDRRRVCEVLGQVFDLSRDLRDLMQFADGCVARALIFEASDEETRKSLVDEVLGYLELFPMLKAESGHEQTREALYALRSCMRSALRSRCPGEAMYAGALGKLERFEEALFTVTPPRFHFASRLPLLLLGKLWPQIYGRLSERRKDIKEASVQELERIYEKFDLPSLIRALAYDTSGVAMPDAEEMLSLAMLFGKKRQSIIHARYEKSLGARSKEAFAEDAWHRCYYLSASERDCWQDPKAQELLRQLLIQERVRSFSLPFLGTFRVEQLSEELESKGVVLLYSPYAKPREPAVDCMLRFPIESRIFARVHAPYFKILPVFYQLRASTLKQMVGQIHKAGFSCWCAGILQKIQGEEAMKEVFGVKHIPLSKNQGQDLGCVFRASQPDQPAALMLQEIFQVQREFFRKALSALRGAPQTEAWTHKLTEVVGEDPGVVDAVVFSAFERGSYGPGVLVLAADHKSDERLQELFRERQLSVFWEDDRGSRLLMFKLRGGEYSPCYKFGGSDWSQADIKIVQDCVNDMDKVAAIRHGVKAVLFSDVPSGLLHEEIVCRLPLSLHGKKELWTVLASHGVALYVWNCGFKSLEVENAFQQSTQPRVLTIDMIFDESENLYDYSVFHRRDESSRRLVEQHIRSYLRNNVPETFAQVASEGPGAVKDGSIMAFLREEQLQVRESEDDLSWKIMKKSCPMVPLVLLSPAGRPRTRLLTLPNKRRIFHSRCLEPQCGKLGTREVTGTGRLVACDSCDPWGEVRHVDASLAACQFRLGTSGACGRPAAKMLKNEKGAAPKFYCRDHGTLETVSPEALAGCGAEADNALVHHNVAASLNVFEADTMAECFKFNSLKESGPLFGDAKISPGCLEVQMLLEVRLRAHLQQHAAEMRKVQLVLTRDKATASLLTVCLRSELEHRCPVWNLDDLASSMEADFDKQVKNCRVLQSAEEFKEALGRDRRQAMWIRNFFTETGDFEHCRGDGELPADKRESERSEGAFVGEVPEDALGALPVFLRKQLEARSPAMQKMQTTLAEKIWKLRALARYVLCRDRTCLQFSWTDTGKSPLVAAVDVSWFFLCTVFEDTDRVSASCKEGKCWGDVLEANLEKYTQIFRQEPVVWQVAGGLSQVSRCLIHAGALEEPTKLRPALWQDVAVALDLHVDRDVALKELQLVDNKFRELFHKAEACGGPIMACGLVNSVLPNYKASLAAIGLRAATPHAFVLRLLEPRIEEVESFCELVGILFQNEVHWTKHVDARKVPLRTKHVTLLAQEYFWSHKHRGRLSAALREIRRLFDTASTSINQRRVILDSCFNITSSTVKDCQKHNFSGRVFIS